MSPRTTISSHCPSWSWSCSQSLSVVIAKLFSPTQMVEAHMWFREKIWANTLHWSRVDQCSSTTSSLLRSLLPVVPPQSSRLSMEWHRIELSCAWVLLRCSRLPTFAALKSLGHSSHRQRTCTSSVFFHLSVLVSSRFSSWTYPRSVMTQKLPKNFSLTQIA